MITFSVARKGYGGVIDWTGGACVPAQLRFTEYTVFPRKHSLSLYFIEDMLLDQEHLYEEIPLASFARKTAQCF